MKTKKNINLHGCVPCRNENCTIRHHCPICTSCEMLLSFSITPFAVDDDARRRLVLLQNQKDYNDTQIKNAVENAKVFCSQIFSDFLQMTKDAFIGKYGTYDWKEVINKDEYNTNKP